MIIVEINKQKATVTLSYQELIILINSINEAREALNGEFSTRVGVELAEAELLLGQIQRVLAVMNVDSKPKAN